MSIGNFGMKIIVRDKEICSFWGSWVAEATGRVVVMKNLEENLSGQNPSSPIK